MKNLFYLFFILSILYSCSPIQETGRTQQPLRDGDNDVDTPEANATVRIFSGNCTGTLINPTTILSAGHCFTFFKHPLCAESCNKDNVNPLCEGVVDHNLESSNPCDWVKPGHWYPLDRQVKIEFGNDVENMHETVYAHHINFTGWADIVLLKLEKSISPEVAIPATPLTRLPTEAIDDPSRFWDEQEFSISGWGEGTGNIRKVGKATGATYRDNAPWPSSCRADGQCGCTPTKICLKNEDAIISDGDSGGPLYWVDGSGKKYVIGADQQPKKHTVTFTRGGQIYDGKPTPNIGGWIEACLDEKSNFKSYDQTGQGRNERLDLFGSSFAVGNFFPDDFLFPDLAVGAPGEDYNGSGVNAGVVYLFEGTDLGLTNIKILTQDGAGRNETGDKFGSSIATGDVNNDGLVDIFVGAPGEDYNGSGPNAGMVYYFQGTANGVGDPVLITQDPTNNHEGGDLFGSTILVADFNGDGVDDLVVGCPGKDNDKGAVYFYRGSVSGIDATPSVIIPSSSVGNRSEEKFGEALTAGDFNNDGVFDLVVGAPGKKLGTTGSAGTIYIFLGSTGGLHFDREFHQSTIIGGENEYGDKFGSALAVGDFNANGNLDLVVGSPGENNSGTGINEGAVYVFFDINSSRMNAQIITQTPFGRNEAGDLFGASLAVGDLNGDTVDDLAIGSPGENFNGSGAKAGLVYLSYGLPEKELSKPFAINQKPAGRNEANDLFGASLIMLPKYPNMHELIIGVPGEDVNSSGPNAGIFYHRPWDIIKDD